MAVEPWHFANHVMVLQEMPAGEQVTRDELYEVPFWIQIHGLPPDHLTTETSKRIGDELGRCVDIDDGGSNSWRVEYIRVRVFIDTRKPIRRGMKLMMKTNLIWVDFRYECLQNFCYCCGMLDHVERDCELGLEMEAMGVRERPYGEKLWATPKRLSKADETGSRRWLRDASGNPVVAEVVRQQGSSINMEGANYVDLRRFPVDSVSHDYWSDKGRMIGASMASSRDMQSLGRRKAIMEHADNQESKAAEMERQYALNDGNIIQYSRRETTTIIGIGDINAKEGTASKISTEPVEPNGPVLVQTYVWAEPMQTNQAPQSDSIFLFSAVQANDTPRIRA
ncbi:hypothetical protein SLA2020_076140 [Shorea laevis]